MFEFVSACAVALTLAQPAAARQNLASEPPVSTARQNHPSEPSVSTARQNHPSEPSVSTARQNHPSEPPVRTLIGLYVSFASLQALDVHSTLSVLSDGGVEANPAMRGITGHPATFIAVKAAAAVTTIWVSEKLRKKHPKGAVVLMVALNSAMAAVVANNYRH